MARAQWLVLAGIAAACALSAGFIAGGLWAVRTARGDGLAGWSPAQAAGFAVLLAGLSLAAGIGWAARTRLLGPRIDGALPQPGSGLDLTLRYVTNTTEQLLLFAVACAGAAALIPDTARDLLPVMGCWFVLARALFYAGYRLHPLARSVGFAATFFPTMALMTLTLLAAVS